MIHAIVTGNLGRDPEMKATKDGRSMLRFSVGSSDRAKNDAGEWGDKTTWVDVMVFGQRSEALNKVLEKGTRVAVRGKLATREYRSTAGELKTSMEIAADDVELLGGSRSAAATTLPF